jgi:hypothetical protein
MSEAHLDRGRRAYDRRAWKDAYQSLSLADRDSTLRAADLERLAIAAFLIGREKEFERMLGRAHRAYRDAGDRPGAARCAFWIGLLLFLGGNTGAATGGWRAPNGCSTRKDTRPRRRGICSYPSRSNISGRASWSALAWSPARRRASARVSAIAT